MCILFLLFFEVLIIDRNWLIQINFILWGFFTISINDLLLVFSNVFVHMTMLQMLQATKKAAVGKWWLLLTSVALPRSDVQE